MFRVWKAVSLFHQFLSLSFSGGVPQVTGEFNSCSPHRTKEEIAKSEASWAQMPYGLCKGYIHWCRFNASNPSRWSLHNPSVFFSWPLIKQALSLMSHSMWVHCMKLVPYIKLLNIYKVKCKNVSVLYKISNIYLKLNEYILVYIWMYKTLKK